MELSGADRYNPNMLPQLEKFADEQVAKGGAQPYSLPANLALLRLYVTQPDNVKTKLLSQLLVKAMMQLPETDFTTMLHLVPERLQEEQPIASLVALMQHLEGARFQSFWLVCEACRDTLNEVPGFADALRAYILKAINSTCQKVTRATLAEYLRLDGVALEQLINSKAETEGWKVMKSDAGKTIIQLPKTSQNILKEPSSQTSAFRFEQLAPLLASS